MDNINRKIYLSYKGILFDEWVEDEYGIWTTICPDCINKYYDSIASELESHGSGCCSVKDCKNEDNDDVDMKYLNIKDNDIIIFDDDIFTMTPILSIVNVDSK